ncbi:FAD/NAD(P)-binding domain-containing protein [Imleria badia]|nr:FAD/NAD(P)-binding domain-containing protein [Imleria badia]
MRPIVGLVLLAGVAVATVQKPFSTPSFEAEENGYQFDWPIRKVAVIGAGPSGMIAYRELTEAGLEVRVFERDSVPGGNWHYTDEVPLDAPVPNVPCPIADFVPSVLSASVDLPHSEEFEDDGKIRRDHRGPKPIWESLTSNTPSPLQQFAQWPWPAGTQWELTHYQARNYVRSYASYLNINSNDENPAVAYNTRVELVEKRINQAGQEQGWRLWLRSLVPTKSNTYRATWWAEDFDAVVVAVGRYNAPSMPSIPGLEEWVQRFPDLVRHARQYRRPEAYANQTVLLVGASVSGSEISRDLNRHVRKIYQSFRPDNNNTTHLALENSLRWIPKNTTFVGEIDRFLPIPEGSPIQSGLVELKNDTMLAGIDSVILATGFRYSFPFLPQYYDGATYEPHNGSATTVLPFLPMDGSHIRDLYLDLFYFWDPTLAFLGVPLGAQSFTNLDYMPVALAKVWANKAKLPNAQTMWALHEKTVEERGGYGKYVMFWGPQRSVAMFTYLIGWLNEAAAKYGGKQVDPLPKYFEEIDRYWNIALYGGPLQLTGPKEDHAMLASLGIVPRDGADQGRNDVLCYDDEW